MKNLTIVHTNNATLIGDRNIGHELESALSEFKHNSIDSEASNIWIDFDRENNIIKIEDDGKGMSNRTEIEDFFNVGHQQGISNLIGGYGFGAYYGSIYLAQKVVLMTKKSGDKKYNMATWQPDRKAEDVNIDNPKIVTLDTIDCTSPQEINSSYTKVHLHIVDVDKERYDSIGWGEFSKPDSQLFKKYVTNMKIRFKGQIQSGKNIFIDGIRLKPDADPLFLKNSDVATWDGNETVYLTIDGEMVPVEFFGVSLENVKDTIVDFDSQKGGRKQDCQGIYLELCPQSMTNGVLLTLGESNWAGVNEKNPNKTHARLKIKIDERAKQFFGISTIKNKPNMKFNPHSTDPNVKIMVDKIKGFLSWIDRRYKAKPKRAKKSSLPNKNKTLSEIANQIKILDTSHMTPMDAMIFLNDLKSKLITENN